MGFLLFIFFIVFFGIIAAIAVGTKRTSKKDPQIPHTPTAEKPPITEPEPQKQDAQSVEVEKEKKPLEEVIKGKIRKSRPLSMNEQPTLKRLRETLEPKYVVLAQVSFGAILWTWSYAVRNRYNRKIADFVVCDQGFNVVAVIELDDSSHEGNEKKDAERDLLLEEAGIAVFRYRFTPEVSQILRDINSVE